MDHYYAHPGPAVVTLGGEGEAHGGKHHDVALSSF